MLTAMAAQLEQSRGGRGLPCCYLASPAFPPTLGLLENSSASGSERHLDALRL